MILGVWMASPYLLSKNPPAETPATSLETAGQKPAPFKVRVNTFEATLRKASVSARGVTEASKTVEVRARTSGAIAESNVIQGQQVARGDLLCRLDMAARTAQLAQAKAALASAQRDHDASAKLVKSNLTTKSQFAADVARLDGAKAALEAVEWDIGWTEIKAPVAGILIDKPSAAGSSLASGDLCAVVSQLDPLVISVQVSERYISYLWEGMVAKAILATGEKVEGTVRFIARNSDLATRTFRVELAVRNADYKIRAGVTAELVVDLPASPAHLLPGSLLGLNDQGQFGVRLLNADKTTSFVAVEVIAQETTGMWVSGLPASVTLVTTGQDYVRDGETVDPVAEKLAGSQ